MVNVLDGEKRLSEKSLVHWKKEEGSREMLLLCSLMLSGDVGDVIPGLKSFLHQSMIGRCFESMSSRSNRIGDRTKGGEEPLGVSSRGKATHRPFALPCWLARRLCSILQTVVLRMCYTGPDLLPCRNRAGQFVRDDHPWNRTEPFEQLTEKLFGSLLVAPALDRNIEDVTIPPIDRSPELVLLAIDVQKHLITMPLVPRFGTTFFQFIGVRLTEFQTPLTDGFIDQHDSTCRHDLFDVAITEREAKTQPDAVADDCGRKTLSFVLGSCRRLFHTAEYAILFLCSQSSVANLRIPFSIYFPNGYPKRSDAQRQTGVWYIAHLKQKREQYAMCRRK